MNQRIEKPVRVEEIMKEIKDRAAARDFSEIPDFDELETDLPLDDEYDYSILDSEIHQLCMHYELDSDLPLAKGGVKGLAQKVIRKLTRFLLVPLTSQQTMFNTSTVRGVNQLKNFIDVQDKENQALRNRIAQLEEELNALKNDPDR